MVTKPTQKEEEEERKPLSKRRVAFIQVGLREMKHKSDDGGGGGGGSVVEVTAAVAPFCVTAAKGEGGDGSGVTLRGFFIIITSHGGKRERSCKSSSVALSVPPFSAGDFARGQDRWRGAVERQS